MDTPLFLDTSICIDRVLAPRTKRRPLNLALAGQEALAINSVVLRELFRTLIRDMVELKRDLQEWAADPPEGVYPLNHLLRALEEEEAAGLKGGRSRTRKRAILLDLSDDLDELKQNVPGLSRTQQTRWILGTLDDLRQRTFRSFRNLTLKGVNREIHLRWNPELETEEEVRRLYQQVQAGDGMPFTSPAFPHGAGPFLDQRSEDVEAVYQAVSALRKKPPTGLLRVIDWARDKKTARTDFTSWLPGKKTNPWYLADMLIVMDTPEDARIASKDHAFRTLCPTLGRDLVTLDELLTASAVAEA